MKKVFSKMTIKFLSVFFLFNALLSALSSSEVLAEIKRKAPSGETSTFEAQNPESQNPMSVLAKPVAKLKETAEAERKLDPKRADKQQALSDSLRSGKLTADEAQAALNDQDKADEENKDKNPKNPQAASVSIPEVVTPKSSSSAANWLLPLAAIGGVGAIALLASGSDKPSSSSESPSSWQDPSVLADASVTYSSDSLPEFIAAPGASASATSVRVYDKAKVEEWFKSNNINPDDDGDFSKAVEKLDPALGEDFLRKAGAMNEIHQNLSQVENLAGKDRVKYACEGEGKESCGLDYEGIRRGLETYANYREQELALEAQIGLKPESEAADLRSQLETLKTNIASLKTEIGKHIEQADLVAKNSSSPTIKRLFANAKGLIEGARGEIEKADAAKIKKLIPHLKKDWNHFVKKHSEFGHEPNLAEAVNPTAATREMFASATRAPTLLAELPAEGGVLDTYSPHRGAPGDSWISPSDAADFRNL